MTTEAALRKAEQELGIVHRDGIPWYDAPVPRHWHRCEAWTTSYEIDRCACGAYHLHGFPGWGERNSRRRK